ncbi:hypothetical protein PPYR_12327 [Photinus pyralis]|uniref:Sugar phosphate transporter domain-containing protein n=1 Tax=Photinus pyralis TaxID=7054 RepID=A0A1Y1LLQ1_PHOPY|nr:solute carrier family 35 member E3-like [Photinus pyralis]KAB0795488.1 hypothetical protein PPYR_12327 [Photinus pyralis]
MYSREKHRQPNSTAHRKLRSRSKMSVVKTVLYLIANIASSITIILLNKWIYSQKIFPNISLTMVHFIATFCSLCVCEKLNFFNVKSVNVHQLVTLSLCFCGFVVFTNLSLEYNSVGAFQVAKVMTTPGVMIIQSFRGKQFSHSVKFATVPIVVGVILCFSYDIRFNTVGTVFATLGVIVTSFYQVLVNSKQAEMQLNSMQLLFYQAPLSAFLLCLCIPFLEPEIVTTFLHHWTLTEVCFITISCLAAVLVNLTTYWILGNTSPLTYNMVGHMKFVLIMLGGWYLYDREMSQNQWFGVCLTLFGLIVYTHIKIKENEARITSPTEIRTEKN